MIGCIEAVAAMQSGQFQMLRFAEIGEKADLEAELLVRLGTFIFNHQTTQQRDPALLHGQGIGLDGVELELEHFPVLGGLY